MIAGSSVLEVSNSLNTILSDYSTQVQGLSSNWHGTSYDSFKKQTDQFKQEFEEPLISQIEAFANACDEYINYEKMKDDLETAEENYNICKNANDRRKMHQWSNEINTLNKNIETSKSNIQTYLTTASSTTLTASSLGGSSISPSINNSNLSTKDASSVGTSNAAITAHSRISEDERNDRISYLGGEGSESEQDSKMTVIKVPYWDGSTTKEMQLKVNKKLTNNYYNAFKELSDMHFEIKPKETGAYNYRKTTKGTRLSDHAYGSAVDVNWNHNEEEGDGSSYAVRNNEAVINAFAKQGFYWGGDWNSWHDDMHFTYTGW